jgi:hypothetical protein
MTAFRILQALLAATLLVTPRGAALASAAKMPMDLQVFLHAAIDAATLDLATASATELLGVAGIRVDWRQCLASGAGCRSEDASGAVVVRVLAVGPADRDVCGGASPESPDGDVIMVYLPCHQAAARAVRVKLAAGSDPRLATLEIGHLLGLTMAHEIGHVLGLAHASGGVMQARFDMVDFLDLRMSRLAFTKRERLWMRQAMLARAGSRPLFRSQGCHRIGASDAARRHPRSKQSCDKKHTGDCDGPRVEMLHAVQLALQHARHGRTTEDAADNANQQHPA